MPQAPPPVGELEELAEAIMSSRIKILPCLSSSRRVHPSFQRFGGVVSREAYQGRGLVIRSVCTVHIAPMHAGALALGRVPL